MEGWWFLCFIPLALVLGFELSESNSKKNKNKIKKLKSKLKKYEKGTTDMSKIITDLIGKKCRIGILGIDGNLTVLDADEEWIKYEYTDKKGSKHIKIQRTDELSEITLLD